MSVINKSKSAFRTITEVAEELGVATHVLRFWETKFSQITPMKATGGRRYYRPEDVEVLKLVKSLLYDNRYTIEGAQQFIRNNGLKNLLASNKVQGDFFTDNTNAADAENNKKLSSASEAMISEAICELRKLKHKLQKITVN